MQQELVHWVQSGAIDIISCMEPAATASCDLHVLSIYCKQELMGCEDCARNGRGICPRRGFAI
jgi:hypothetical protein